MSSCKSADLKICHHTNQLTLNETNFCHVAKSLQKHKKRNFYIAFFNHFKLPLIKASIYILVQKKELAKTKSQENSVQRRA